MPNFIETLLDAGLGASAVAFWERGVAAGYSGTLEVYVTRRWVLTDEAAYRAARMFWVNETVARYNESVLAHLASSRDPLPTPSARVLAPLLDELVYSIYSTRIFSSSSDSGSDSDSDPDAL